jgi:predicted naringenin-chalcone synthase
MRSIATAVPSTTFSQPVVRDVFASQPDLGRLGKRLIGAAFDASGIERRHTVIEELDFEDRPGDSVFYDSASGRMLTPGTRVRNELYIAQAAPLFLEAGRKALEACPELRPEDVTHVITVSCTGFYAPGPDYQVVRDLGLATTTQRYHIGFMGCYAAFPALRAAKSFCEADPNAVVLVISAELCSLHVRSSNDPDQIVAASVFSDGASATVVTGRTPPPGARTLRIDHLATELTPVGESDMAWKIGDEGFEMVLSSYVPKIIDEYIEGALAPLLANEPQLAEAPYRDIEHWAVHPGGRSILDKVESKLGLSEKQLAPSRQTLRDYGNMSSATILFVLKQILDGPVEDGGGERVCAMAFGPGLTVEAGLFTRIPATVGAPSTTEGAAEDSGEDSGEMTVAAIGAVEPAAETRVPAAAL